MKDLQKKITDAMNQAIETGSAEITITRPESPEFGSVHGVMKEIKKIIPLTPEQEFRIHAMIKRHDHCSKLDVYSKIKWWLGMGYERGPVPPHIVWVTDNIDLKIQTHKEMAVDPDEEIVTYNVGSHIYKPKPRSTDSGLQ